MDKDKMLTMDTYILLSWINTKLRDEFENFSILCEEYNVQEKDIKNKLHNIEYIYNEKTNQFVAEETI